MGDDKNFHGFYLGHDVESIPRGTKDEFGMAIMKTMIGMSEGKKISYNQALAILDYTKNMVGERLI